MRKKGHKDVTNGIYDGEKGQDAGDGTNEMIATKRISTTEIDHDDHTVTGNTEKTELKKQNGELWWP